MNVSSQCKLELARAQSILDTRHYGLNQVKQRILEFLAAKTLCGKAKQNILIVDDEEIARANMEHVLKRTATTAAAPKTGSRPCGSWPRTIST